MRQGYLLFWICFFFAVLGYGCFLYWRFGLLPAENAKGFKHQLGELSENFEQTLSQGLYEKRHLTLSFASQLKLVAFNGAITSKVEVGKEGWLFLKQEEKNRNTIEQSLGIQQYSALELKQWTLLFKQRQFWTEKRNRKYVLVFAPNKASVYPEFLSNRYRIDQRVTATDRLKAELDEIFLIDLGEHLKLNKNKGQLFQKTDTHWSDLGAFLAYQHLIASLPEPFRDTPLSLKDIQQEEIEKPAGDLARLLLMDQNWMERHLQLSLKDTNAVFHPERSQSIGPNLTPLVYSNAQTNRPKVLFDHDSFGKYLVPYLAEHFKESVFLWGWQGFHTGLIRREQPDLVVDQFVERALIGALPRNDWEVIQEYWEQHFGKLADEKIIKTLPCSKIITWVKEINQSENKLAIVKIHFQPKELDKLIVNYSYDRGYYWLPPEGRTYYLEFYQSNIESLELEKFKDINGEVELRYY